MNETITFALTGADGFGDDVVTAFYATSAAVEQVSAFTHGINAELQTGEVIAWIEPASEVWQDQGMKMSGMTAEYNDTSYRVIGVRPGGSLLTAEEDLIELTLTKSENNGE